MCSTCACPACKFSKTAAYLKFDSFSEAYDTHTICCFAATAHLVTMATLKKANKVIRLQKKAQRLGTQGQTQADADVVDVE